MDTSVSIPLAVLLVPYGLFLFAFLFYAGFTVNNLLRYGFSGRSLSALVAIFSVGSFVLLVVSLLLLTPYPWFTSFTLNDLFSRDDKFSQPMMRLNNLPNQRPDERVELFLRRHWIEVFELFLAFTFLFGLPLVAILIYHDPVSQWLARPIVGPLLAVLGGMYFMAIWLFTFVEFTDYYLDTWIVTTERIINIEQFGLFRRTAAELHLADVQDATSDVSGILQTFLNYGDVIVETASPAVHFHFRDIPQPELVKQQILKLVDEDRGRGHQALVGRTASPIQNIPNA